MAGLTTIIPKPLRTAARAVQRSLHAAYCQATWRSRVLPDFIIVGAQRAGTSSLYHYLGQHPQLIPSYVKEVHYFDGGLNPAVDTFGKGTSWYTSHFPRRLQIRTNQQTFEASPLYIFNPLAPARIADLIPRIRLILLVRDPAERAISHYFHERRRGAEPLSILDAFQAEEERMKPVLDRGDFKSEIFIRQSYKSRGLYLDQIKRYLRHFDAQALLVLASESLFTDPDATIRRILQFLDVDANAPLADFRPYNVGANRRDVATDVQRYLRTYFHPHNQALFDFVGEKYPW